MNRSGLGPQLPDGSCFLVPKPDPDARGNSVVAPVCVSLHAGTPGPNREASPSGEPGCPPGTSRAPSRRAGYDSNADGGTVPNRPVAPATDRGKATAMEYLVTMTTHVPDGTPDQAVADLRAREAAHSSDLVGQGHLLRLWRPRARLRSYLAATQPIPIADYQLPTQREVSQRRVIRIAWETGKPILRVVVIRQSAQPLEMTVPLPESHKRQAPLPDTHKR